MKALMVLSFLFCYGCATTSRTPSLSVKDNVVVSGLLTTPGQRTLRQNGAVKISLYEYFADNSTVKAVQIKHEVKQFPIAFSILGDSQKILSSNGSSEHRIDARVYVCDGDRMVQFFLGFAGPIYGPTANLEIPMEEMDTSRCKSDPKLIKNCERICKELADDRVSHSNIVK